MIGVPASSAAIASLAAATTGRQVLLAPGLLLQPRDRLLDRLQVGEDHLGLDRGDVVGGVDLAVDVGDVLVAEDPGHLADRRRLADVGQELVAEPLPLRRAPDDAGDVDELHGRGQHPCRAEQLGQPRQPVVGDADDADVGLDRGERVVRREDVVLGQRVEEGGLARVGEPDDADGECHGRRVYEPAAHRSESAANPAPRRDSHVTGGTATLGTRDRRSNRVALAPCAPPRSTTCRRRRPGHPPTADARRAGADPGGLRRALGQVARTSASTRRRRV